MKRKNFPAMPRRADTDLFCVSNDPCTMIMLMDNPSPRRQSQPSRGQADTGDSVFSVISGVLLLAGGLLVGSLVSQWLGSRVAIWGSPVVSDGGSRNDVVTASVSFLLLAGACILAIVGRNRSLAWVAGIFLAADLVAALVFVIPRA